MGTEELRRQEALKRELENKEQERKAAEERSNDLAKKQEEMQKNFETNLQKQKEGFETQQKRERAALEENMKKHSEEKAKLLEDGFKEKVALMQETAEASCKQAQAEAEKAKIQIRAIEAEHQALLEFKRCVWERKCIGLINYTDHAITFTSTILFMKRSQAVGAKSKVVIDWATGEWISTKRNVTVSWPKYSVCIDCGLSLVIKADGSYNVE